MLVWGEMVITMLSLFSSLLTLKIPTNNQLVISMYHFYTKYHLILNHIFPGAGKSRCLPQFLMAVAQWWCWWLVMGCTEWSLLNWLCYTMMEHYHHHHHPPHIFTVQQQQPRPGPHHHSGHWLGLHWQLGGWVKYGIISLYWKTHLLTRLIITKLELGTSNLLNYLYCEQHTGHLPLLSVLLPLKELPL